MARTKDINIHYIFYNWLGFIISWLVILGCAAIATWFAYKSFMKWFYKTWAYDYIDLLMLRFAVHHRPGLVSRVDGYYVFYFEKRLESAKAKTIFKKEKLLELAYLLMKYPDTIGKQYLAAKKENSELKELSINGSSSEI